MIHGIGTDIVKIDRIDAIYARHGDRLARHILMDVEADAFRNERRPARSIRQGSAKHEPKSQRQDCACSPTSHRFAGRPRQWQVGFGVCFVSDHGWSLKKCLSQSKFLRVLAMRFAAKEAVVKAMGTGFAQGM